MQRDKITRVIGDLILECVLAIKASEGYEKFRVYDDIFYLPEIDKGFFYGLLAAHEGLTGKEILPGYKIKNIEDAKEASGDDINATEIIKLLKGRK